jgi:hypothetical protein
LLRVCRLTILATTLLGVMLLGGEALAVTKTCANDPCVGTDGPDKLTGTDRRNEISGLGGRDYIVGGAGADIIRARDGYKDAVDCGPGYDTAYVDGLDRVGPNCEDVRRRSSTGGNGQVNETNQSQVGGGKQSNQTKQNATCQAQAGNVTGGGGGDTAGHFQTNKTKQKQKQGQIVVQRNRGNNENE